MQTTWNLSQLLPDTSLEVIEKIKKESESLIDAFVNKWSKDTSYLTDANSLLSALNEYENILKIDPSTKLSLYFGLSQAQNQSDPFVLQNISLLTSWGTAQANKIQFFILTLGKIPQDKQTEFLSIPVLSHYRKFLERIFVFAPYDLSEPEEKILNILSPFAKSNWVDLVSRLISEETRDGKPFTQLLADSSSVDKTTRDTAAKHLVDIFSKHKTVAEVELNNVYNYKKEIEILRHVPRPDFMRLLGDDIDLSVVDTLRSVVTNNFQVARDYYQLKSQLMGVPKLKYHERNVPFRHEETEISFDESYSLVHKVFGLLDPDFAQVIDNYAQHGQIDVYPHQGKQGGAFCSAGSYNTPGFVLLNHTNKLQDTLTFAHEFGHAVNHEFIRRTQSPIYFENSLGIAEVASTFFEDFVLEEVGREVGEEEKLALYMDKLNDDISTIYRQIACYEFEYELHTQIRQKGYLSSADIGAIFQKHMAAYMGDYVEQGEGSDLYWIYWSHIRRHFYVYSYASGLLISKALQNLVRTDKKNVESLKVFLSAGGSDSPKNIFSLLGIDITSPDFWQTGINETKRLLQDTVELAKKLGKI